MTLCNFAKELCLNMRQKKSCFPRMVYSGVYTVDLGSHSVPEKLWKSSRNIIMYMYIHAHNVHVV